MYALAAVICHVSRHVGRGHPVVMELVQLRAELHVTIQHLYAVDARPTLLLHPIARDSLGKVLRQAQVSGPAEGELRETGISFSEQQTEYLLQVLHSRWR